MLVKVLPTPTKPHYTFNLRDVSRVFQGIAKIRPEKLKSGEKMIKLWIHECQKVFYDRLVNPKDRHVFFDLIIENMKIWYKTEYTEEEIYQANFIFGDFMNVTTREYDLIEDPQKLVKQIAEYMYDTPIQIELFKDAVNHLVRCCRAIRFLRGNMLLIGVGGGGKKSTVTVAASMAGNVLAQIEPSKNYGLREFRREIFEKMLVPAGIEGRGVTF